MSTWENGTFWDDLGRYFTYENGLLLSREVRQSTGKISVLFPYSKPTVATKIDTVSSRDRLKPRREPYWHRVSKGCYLGFRKMVSTGHGNWIARAMQESSGKEVARTLAMLINEAADAVAQRVCTPAGADVAMKLGVNYPQGPFEWLAAWSVTGVIDVLDALDAHYRGERYRVSPWLRRQGTRPPSERALAA